MTTLEEALSVVEVSPDRFQGSTPATRLQRTFGGLVAGQAMVAAVKTVDPMFAVHSLHAYFLGPGTPDQPIAFEIDRIREGRSFVARRVTGVQGSRAIFSMAASFHVSEAGPEHQLRRPDTPSPEELDPEWTARKGLAQFLRDEWPDWDLRPVPRKQTPAVDGTPRQQVWFRYRGHLPEDPLFHVCALTYMSDLTLLSAAVEPSRPERVELASLDHALWFQRPFRADDWLLYDQASPSATAGRALTQGRIFTRTGALVASVTQEGLMRHVD